MSSFLKRLKRLKVIKSFLAIVVTIQFFGLADILRSDDLSPIGAVDVSCKSAKGISPQEEASAVASLKIILIDKYIASLDPSRQAQVSARRAELVANPDAAMQNFGIRSKAFDKSKKIATLSAQADINKSKVDSLIDGNTGGGEKNPIVFIFVARRQSEVESKGPIVKTGTKQDQGSKEEASAQNKGGVASATTSSSTTQTVTTADSVIRKADSIVYIIEDNMKAAIDRTMSKVFVDRQFDTVSAADLVEATKGAFNPDKLIKDFENSSQFTLENQRQAARACREAGAPMLAFGTLTIGVQRKDPVNNSRVLVNVIVDGQILDCRKALTIKVGSIGALQVEEPGADQTQAENAALVSAADRAANILADQLRARGIK